MKAFVPGILLIVGLVFTAVSASLASAPQLECRGSSVDGEVRVTLLPDQDPAMQITFIGNPVRNMIQLDSKIEPKTIYYSILDADRFSALEIKLEKTNDEKWSGAFTDIGEPGTTSRTWQLRCD